MYLRARTDVKYLKWLSSLYKTLSGLCCLALDVRSSAQELSSDSAQQRSQWLPDSLEWEIILKSAWNRMIQTLCIRLIRLLILRTTSAPRVTGIYTSLIRWEDIKHVKLSGQSAGNNHHNDSLVVLGSLTIFIPKSVWLQIARLKLTMLNTTGSSCHWGLSSPSKPVAAVLNPWEL